jgi:hypothetical protein
LIANRLLGVSAVMTPTGPVTGFDMGGLVRRLLLFDKYIVVSIRLQEFRYLAQHLGYARTRDLFDSGLIEIRNECVQMGDLGRSGLFGSPILPPMTYQFNWLEYHDRPATISRHLDGLRDIPGINEQKNGRLREQIAGLINPIPHEAKATFGASFFRELQNVQLVKHSIRLAMSQMSLACPDEFTLSVIREDGDIVRVDTDLAKYGALSDSVHIACQRGLLAVSALTQQIGEMNCYKAISGFREEESPLFRTKMTDVLAAALSSDEKEQRLQRVIEIANFPEYDYDMPLDVDQLLKVREAPEIKEFRDWLQRGDTLSDEDIRVMMTSAKNTFGLVLNDQFGKALRFLCTAAVGFIPKDGLWLGPIASAVDTILSEMFPRPGITAFIHELYPSLFKERPGIDNRD